MPHRWPVNSATFASATKTYHALAASAAVLRPWRALSALVRQARHALDAGTVSSLAEVKPLTGTAILTAAGQGDTLAVRLVTAAMDHLAVAVAGLINLLDPDRIIFSQRLSAVGDSLLERFFHAVVHNASGLHPGAVDLRISSLASHVSARGVCVGHFGPLLCHAILNTSSSKEQLMSPLATLQNYETWNTGLPPKEFKPIRIGVIGLGARGRFNAGCQAQQLR